MNDEKGPRMQRRSFLGLLTGVVASLISAAYAVPAVAFIVGPSLQREREEWIALGSANKVVPDTPTLFKTRVRRKTGWITAEEEVAVYILTKDNREYIAMSNICTHLGCRIRWVADREQFFCPCHVGVFDREGQVVSGPPPRPLDRYPVSVDQDRIFIQVS